MLEPWNIHAPIIAFVFVILAQNRPKPQILITLHPVEEQRDVWLDIERTEKGTTMTTIRQGIVILLV